MAIRADALAAVAAVAAVAVPAAATVPPIAASRRRRERGREPLRPWTLLRSSLK